MSHMSYPKGWALHEGSQGTASWVPRLLKCARLLKCPAIPCSAPSPLVPTSDATRPNGRCCNHEVHNGESVRTRVGGHTLM
jgi:hypothetical protein